MNITLLSYGSRGDVQPMAALALGLQAAGHRVHLAAPQRFADFIQTLGIAYDPLPGDPAEISRQLNAAGTNPLSAMRVLQSYTNAILDDLILAALQACATADCIVHSFLFTAGAHAYAFARGIPDVSIQLFPMFAPTRAFPNPTMSRIPPGALSALSHRFSTWGYWQSLRYTLRRWKNPDPQRIPLKLHWPFDPHPGPVTPLIFAFSPSVVPRPADWAAAHIHIPGYFFLDTPSSYRPPAALHTFLESGPAPLCVSFGSMLAEKAQALRAQVLQALAQTDQRAVLLSGWDTPAQTGMNGNIFQSDSIPHDWLLPRCSAVLHHGGAGTTAAGLRAGIPAIVVPHMGDQPFWGQRVAALGVGPQPITLKRVDAERLAQAILQTQNAEMRARAQTLGTHLRAESGVRTAVELIESHVAAYRRAY